MPLLSRKYKPVPVHVPMPGLDRMRLPDLSILRKNAQRVQLTNDLAMDEGQSPAVREFSLELGFALYEAFDDKMLDVDTSEEDDVKFMGAIGMSVCFGLGYSAVDDNLRIPRGMSEQCTLTALDMGVTSLDGFPHDWQQPFMFSMQAGHYMGRMGRSAIPDLVYAAAH